MDLAQNEIALENSNPGNAPANVESGPSKTNDEAGLLARLSTAASGAFERGKTIIRRGRGRPRGDGQPKANDVVAQTTPDLPSASVQPPAVAVPASTLQNLSPGLLRRCVSGLIKGALSVPNFFLKNQAIRKGRTEEQAQALLAGCLPDNDEITGLTELAEILIRKYSLDTTYAPELAAGCILGGIGLRYVTALAELKKYPDVQGVEVDPKNIVKL